jgi:ubiquinone/menaquinone biosynthesis C-methylase UbiE
MFLSKIKSTLYNSIIRFTADSYTEVLTELEPNTRLLDVGIGTAEALLRNTQLIKNKNITIVGIDIDTAYLAEATRVVAQTDIANQIKIIQADISETSYDHLFDAVYFSDSFMLIPKQKRVSALYNAKKSLKGHLAKIYFTQTHETHRSILLEFIKPRIKLLTSIDFGLVTYESEFFETLHEAGLFIVSQKRLYGNKKRAMILSITTAH